MPPTIPESAGQVIDLFGRCDPLLGRALCMDQACPCGNNVTLICAGKGPHAAELRCRNCDRHRQWLSHDDYRTCGAVIAEITERVGEPIEILYRVIHQRRSEAMTEYDNTNRGALFKNDDKQNSKHADYKGTLNVDGVEHWLNAWIKESKKGVKYMSLSIKPKKEKARASERSLAEDMDDQIPF